MSRISSYELQYPRRKHIIYNLSELLNQKPIMNPEAPVNWKMFPQQNKQISRNSKTANSTARNQNMNLAFKRKLIKMNFQHYRSKSTLKQKSLRQENKINQNKKQIKIRQKNPSLDLTPFQLTRNPSVQGVSLIKSYKSHQFQSQNFLKSSSPIKYAFRQQLFASQKYHLNQYDQNIFARSVELKKKFSQPSLLIRSNSKGQDLISNKQQKKQFLKKGSSLQKQIVVNLLRNKILKEHQYQVKKEYTPKDILNMVKLYKGINGKNQRDSQTDRIKQIQKRKKIEIKKQEIKIACPIKVLQKFQKPIQGWEIQPQYQIQAQRPQQDYQKLEESTKIL